MQQRAADRVTLHQAHRIAMPRRFSIPMQEIWLLQARFDIRQRKRVFRLLAHPRFRAAYDFLALRMVEQPELAEPVAFWTEAQTLSHDGLAERLAAAPPVATTDQAAAPRKRARRRRRHASASDSGTPDTAP
jgi:poly(A) polymerase